MKLYVSLLLIFMFFMSLVSCTPEISIKPKGDGVFLVEHEIGFGRWQSDSNAGENCYWVRRKYDGIVRGEYYGKSGVIMEIVSGDFEVEMKGCGIWIYIGE